MVDVTHSTGRKDIMLPTAKALVGADGVMAEVHPDPSVALSDSGQQMDLNEFDQFYNELKPLVNYIIQKIKIISSPNKIIDIHELFVLLNYKYVL